MHCWIGHLISGRKLCFITQIDPVTSIDMMTLNLIFHLGIPGNAFIRVRGLPARLSYPLRVWGWGWAGAGNSSVLAVAAVAPARGKKKI